jgi:hypothetical protein
MKLGSHTRAMRSNTKLNQCAPRSLFAHIAQALWRRTWQANRTAPAEFLGIVHTQQPRTVRTADPTVTP